MLKIGSRLANVADAAIEEKSRFNAAFPPPMTLKVTSRTMVLPVAPLTLAPLKVNNPDTVLAVLTIPVKPVGGAPV